MAHINIHDKILQTERYQSEIYISIVDRGLSINNVAQRFEFKQGAY